MGTDRQINENGERSFFVALEAAAKGPTIVDGKTDALRLRRLFEDLKRDGAGEVEGAG